MNIITNLNKLLAEMIDSKIKNNRKSFRIVLYNIRSPMGHEIFDNAFLIRMRLNLLNDCNTVSMNTLKNFNKIQIKTLKNYLEMQSRIFANSSNSPNYSKSQMRALKKHNDLVYKEIKIDSWTSYGEMQRTIFQNYDEAESKILSCPKDLVWFDIRTDVLKNSLELLMDGLKDCNDIQMNSLENSINLQMRGLESYNNIQIAHFKEVPVENVKHVVLFQR
jgi:hypothetical protein